jgi:HSP20 family protein
MAPKITRSEGMGSGRNYPVTPFRLFEDLFNDWATRTTEGRRPEAWNPPVDIVEREGNLILMLSLPGLTEREIELKIEGQVLTIKGERKSLESQGFTYHQMEGYCGIFSRSFTLPDSTDLENIKADYKNGILSISIPQKPDVKSRTIKVSV